MENKEILIIQRKKCFNQLLKVLYSLEDIDGYNHNNINTQLINALRKFTGEKRGEIK